MNFWTLFIAILCCCGIFKSYAFWIGWGILMILCFVVMWIDCINNAKKYNKTNNKNNSKKK